MGPFSEDDDEEQSEDEDIIRNSVSTTGSPQPIPDDDEPYIRRYLNDIL